MSLVYEKTVQLSEGMKKKIIVGLLHLTHSR